MFKTSLLNDRVPTHPGKSWKVMEFKKGIFRAWKVMENDCGHGMSWKSHGIPPYGHEIQKDNHLRSLTMN